MSVRSLLRVFLAVLWLWPATALAQVEQWQSHMDAGVKAYFDNDYTEAEKQFTAAVKEAEQFGPEDPRLATTLNSLAEVHRAQGRLEEAEALHKRALAIIEKALGPEHPDVATSLNNLADLYRALGKYAEVEPLHKRALGIREKALEPEHHATWYLWTVLLARDRSTAGAQSKYWEGGTPPWGNGTTFII